MGCCNGGSTPAGDCTDALTSIVRLCQKWYGTPQARDLVDGYELARVLESYGTAINDVKRALAQIMGTDCRLKDGIIRCANLSDEIGQACLYGTNPPEPIPPPGPQPGGPIFDALPASFSPDFAYSLRRVREAYTGPLVRLRRALDNAELDIGTDETNLLDTAAIVDFAQGSDCFVRTWYDQAGQFAGANMVQTTPSQQPKIYDGITGFELTSTGRIAMRFIKESNSSFGMEAPSSPTYSTRALMLAAFSYLVTGNSDFFGLGNVTGRQISINVSGGTFYEDFIPYPSALPLNTPTLVNVRGATTQSFASLNGSTCGTAAPELAFQDGPIWMGTGGSTKLTYRFMEAFLFLDTEWAQEVDPGVTALARLEQNVMATWGIIPA